MVTTTNVSLRPRSGDLRHQAMPASLYPACVANHSPIPLLYAPEQSVINGPIPFSPDLMPSLGQAGRHVHTSRVDLKAGILLQYTFDDRPANRHSRTNTQPCSGSCLVDRTYKWPNVRWHNTVSVLGVFHRPVFHRCTNAAPRGRCCAVGTHEGIAPHVPREQRERPSCCITAFRGRFRWRRGVCGFRSSFD